MAQQQGKITSWKQERGFGFITPERGNEQIFFHIKHVVEGRTQIAEHTPVYYTLSYDERQRPQAIQISVGQQRLLPLAIRIAAVACFFLVLEALSLLVALPFWPVVGYLLLSAVTFVMYAMDKSAAVAGQQRLPEVCLHGLELVGGWPGALIAQQYFRHKNRKTSYQTAFWIVVALNLCALIGLGLLLHGPV